MSVRKGLLLVVAMFLLSACSTVSTESDIIKSAFSRPIASGTNYTKSYFRYYLPPYAGVRESTQTSSLVNIGSDLMMIQLNISDIVAKTYYAEEDTANSSVNPIDISVPDEGRYETLSGSYYDRLNKEHAYTLVSFDVDTSRAFILKNEYVEITALVPKSEISMMLETMITVMRSVEVEEDEVVARFSNKEIINYESVREEFFELAVPESGTLLDMYNRMNPDNPIEYPESDSESDQPDIDYGNVE